MTGGTSAEVRALLAKKLTPKLRAPITLTDGARTVTRTRGELGVRLDLDRMVRGVTAGQKFVPLVLTTDPADTKRALVRIAPAFAAPAVSPRPYVYRGTVHIKPGAHARALDVPATATKLSQAVAKYTALRRLGVTLKKTPPKVTAAQLKGITGVLASFATTTSDNPKRNRNIAVAVRYIDGTVLSSGETFSLNATVGQRTQARGFRTAPVFEYGKKVPGIGGGVSQVTGTLFNAAALAGMAIREVHPHSRPVAYLPPGRDATLAWKLKDLRFTNTTGAPVYIQYTFRDRRLRATLFGKKTAGHRIVLRTRLRYHGPGNLSAILYRTTRDKGRVIHREQLLRHTYRWKKKA